MKLNYPMQKRKEKRKGVKNTNEILEHYYFSWV